MDNHQNVNESRHRKNKASKELPTIRITLLPIKKTISIATRDETVGQVLARFGFPLDQPCGGKGTCGKCKVLVRNTASKPTIAEKDFLTGNELLNGYRLACQCPLEDGMIVFFPETDEEKVKQNILSATKTTFDKALQPFIRKKALPLRMPGINNAITSLQEILLEQIGLEGLQIPLDLLKDITGLFLKSKPATAVFTDTSLIAMESGDTTDCLYGVAIDVGTTSLVTWLVDLNTGNAVYQLSETNPQISFGADILSRISYIQKEPDGLNTLKEAVVATLNRMISNLATQKNISIDSIYSIAIAGNTCMEHIALGINPQTIGKSPFIPVIRSLPLLNASSLGFSINHQGQVLVIPSISGYVGGDITAGIEASGIFTSSELTLFLDIGTNNEIVLGNKESLIACSTAAGPAFEGAQISCGMRAAKGAVERVYFKEEGIEIGVIGNCEPIGICGSGLVDIIAEMLRYGLIDKSGKLVKSANEDLNRRIFKNEQGVTEFLFWQSPGQNGVRLTLTQRDIREVQLAKAAIVTGINVLLEKSNTSLDKVDRIFVAGAFGNYLNLENAISMGIIPDSPIEKIHYLGNTSIAGAYHALLSYDSYSLMKKIAQCTKYIELSSLENFEKMFLANLSF